MSFLDVLDKQPQPRKLTADEQRHQAWLASIEQSKIRRTEAVRKAAEEHRHADEERRKLTAERDEYVARRKSAGDPLRHTQIRILDCQLELTLAENAFKRNPGQKIVLNDASIGISKEESRVKAAQRELKAAQATDERVKSVSETSFSAPATLILPVIPEGVQAPSLENKNRVAQIWDAITGKN